MPKLGKRYRTEFKSCTQTREESSFLPRLHIHPIDFNSFRLFLRPRCGSWSSRFVLGTLPDNGRFSIFALLYSNFQLTESFAHNVVTYRVLDMYSTCRIHVIKVKWTISRTLPGIYYNELLGGWRFWWFLLTFLEVVTKICNPMKVFQKFDSLEN